MTYKQIIIDDQNETIHRLQQECEQLKAEFDKKELIFAGIETSNRLLIEKNNKLKQNLTEIKEICKTNVCKHCHSKFKVDDNYCKNIENCDCYKILQKISECEVEK